MISPIFLIIESLLATVVIVVFNLTLSKKVKTELDFIALLAILWGISVLYVCIYKFVIVKPQEEFLTIFILLLSTNLVTQFIEASLYSRLKIFEKTIMCICSMALWYGFAFFIYDFTVTRNYFRIFVVLPIVAVSGSVLVKRYKQLIPR